MPTTRKRVERQKHMMGIRKVLAAGLVSVLALPLLTASAEAAEWRIERMSGNVQIHDGGSWVALDADRALIAGDAIWTGRNGRILLINNQGSVLLAPKSLVKIPAQALPNSFSVLFQTHGKVSASVDKRRTRHFSIQTPYVAAVVKGTKFDVEIEKNRTRVSVSEGLVGVVDVETGKTVDVSAGSEVAAEAKAGGMSFGQAVAASAGSVVSTQARPGGRGIGQAVAASAHNNGKGKGKGKGKGNDGSRGGGGGEGGRGSNGPPDGGGGSGGGGSGGGNSGHGGGNSGHGGGNSGKG